MCEECKEGGCECRINGARQCGCLQNGAGYGSLLSKWAMGELLKEKIKKKMDAKYGEKMDKMAALIVEVISEKSKNSSELGKKEDELEKACEEMGFGNCCN